VLEEVPGISSGLDGFGRQRLLNLAG